MKLKLSILNTALLIAILGWLLIGSFNQGSNSQQAYVITGELFAQFEYQKELDLEFQATKTEKENQLNSMQQQLKQLEILAKSDVATQEQIEQYQVAYNRYLQQERVMNQELVDLNSQYSLEVWNKLNAFVSDFGEQNGYEVIFGAGGDGNIMYAEEENNITEELIAFCNQKYNGK